MPQMQELQWRDEFEHEVLRPWVDQHLGKHANMDIIHKCVLKPIMLLVAEHFLHDTTNNPRLTQEHLISIVHKSLDEAMYVALNITKKLPQ